MVLLRFLYEIVIRVFVLLTQFAALFDGKAQLWVKGRENWRSRLSDTISADATVAGQTLWMHVSSLGEFEQGRPILEAVREQYPKVRIVLTFFSPSGFEIRKNYPHADLICYLPADTQRNATDFLDLIQPDVAVFVKYDFWANYLSELKKRKIPTALVSALFRPSHPFFQWHGAFWREMLSCFTVIFVQNQSSAQLLQGIGIQQVSVAGDTRVDRVLHIARQAPENVILAAFQKSPVTGAPLPLLIAGSTWPVDEGILIEVLRVPDFEGIKWVFAPHDPAPAAVARLLAALPADRSEAVVRYSDADTATAAKAFVLVIDNVGLLNTLYRYGHIAYIGGGLGKGIHNTLEPAAFGLPVIFGPRYTRFEEARQFVARGGAFVVQNADELTTVLQQLQDNSFYQKASQAVLEYLEESRGATDQALIWLARYFGKPG